MKPVTLYEAPDGSRFSTMTACLDYEKLCETVDSIMAPFGKVRPSNMGAWVQHSPAAVRDAANEIVKLAVARFAPTRAGEEWHPHGIIQRFVDDSSSQCLKSAFYRINCTDLTTGREYDQPYYRTHPNEATTEEVAA